MAIDTQTLQKKLLQLDSYIVEVRKLRSYPREQFVEGELVEDAAERRLEKAIQCAIDIAAHIVSRNNLGNPQQYKDVFHFLGREGYISPYLVDRLEKMAGFRNIIIHEYADVDELFVYNAVQKDIDDIEQFMKIVTERFLTPQSKK